MNIMDKDNEISKQKDKIKELGSFDLYYYNFYDTYNLITNRRNIKVNQEGKSDKN